MDHLSILRGIKRHHKDLTEVTLTNAIAVWLWRPMQLHPVHRKRAPTDRAAMRAPRSPSASTSSRGDELAAAAGLGGAC